VTELRLDANPEGDDGRTARGQLIKEEVREKILNAYIELLREGIPLPTARQIAKQARLSLRGIFKRFTDLGEGRATAIARIEARARSFFLQPIAGDMSAEQGLRLFIAQQTRMFEEIAPFRRVGLRVEHTDPLAAIAARRIRAVAMRDIGRAVRPALSRLDRVPHLIVGIRRGIARLQREPAAGNPDRHARLGQPIFRRWQRVRV
jgi:AcrR family transcriptional regulator